MIHIFCVGNNYNSRDKRKIVKPIPLRKKTTSHPPGFVDDLPIYACPRHGAYAVIRTFRATYFQLPSARSPFLLHGRRKSEMNFIRFLGRVDVRRRGSYTADPGNYPVDALEIFIARGI